MAIQAPTNPDLPSSNLLPGVYLKLNLTGGGGGLNSPSKKLLLIGTKTSGGTGQQDTPIQITNQSDANTYFGRGSDLARMFAAAVAQIGPGVADIYCLPIVAPSGSAKTALITIAGTASTSGYITATICGYTATASIANGDTLSTIASNLNTAISTLLDLPVTNTLSANTGNIILTYRHVGLHGNDLPVMVNIVGGANVTASPGGFTFASSATSAGTVTVNIGGTAITYAVAATDGSNTTATGVAGNINAGGYPCSAAASTSSVTLYYVSDRVVHRINTTMGNVGTQTVTMSVGTAGSGTPTLTTALTNLQPQIAYAGWATCFNDNNSSSTFHGGIASNSLGTFVTHINTYSDGYNQKGQRFFFGATEVLATAGAYQTGTGVQGTAAAPTSRYVEIWQVDSPQQACELAARAAALHIIQDYQPKNYAGFPLKTTGTVPLLAQHKAVRSGPADNNSALYSYYMTPVAYSESGNYNYIVRDRTCSTDPDQRLWSWGSIAVLDYMRADLNSFLGNLFGGKSFKAAGNPRTPNTVTVTSIKEAIAERLRTYDSIDFVDDIDNIVKGITANQDAIVPTRVDVFIPVRIPVALYQIAGNINLS